ncbi:MAG: TetR/AcrR family transcriptional regulator [Candidatus Dormiibacterota bacterium]
MATRVKSKHRDEAESGLSYRQQQALATRRRIAAAARGVFASEGYAGASIESIAKQAGVATRTVYAAYGTKKNILGAVCALWLEEAQVAEAFMRGMAEPEPRKRLAAIAEANRNQWEKGIDVIRILQSAASADASVDRMLHGWMDDRSGGIRQVLAGAESSFRPGMDIETAMTLVRGLSVPEVYIELTGQGWSPDRYQAWLTETLEYQLLGRRPSFSWLAAHPG